MEIPKIETKGKVRVLEDGTYRANPNGKWHVYTYCDSIEVAKVIRDMLVENGVIAKICTNVH